MILLLLSSGTVERNPDPVKYIDIQELLNLKGINILHQNIRGLSINFENLQYFIDRNSKIDILTISETHLKKSENDNIEALYNIYGYDFIFKSREKGIGGGVGIYISNKFDWVRRIDLEKKDIECVWIEIIFSKSKNILISSIYHPPNSSNYLPASFNESFGDMMQVVSIEN